MAILYRNAFLSRFSDRTGLKNSTFLSMYAPSFVRQLLNNENLLLPKATWLMGIPGSGKSTILRLFTTDILIDVIRQKKSYSHVYDVLSEAKIIDDDAIRIIGLYVPIDEFLVETAKVELEGIENRKLFFTLFDLRVAKQLLYALESLNTFEGTACRNTNIKGIASEQLPPRIFSETKNCETLGKEIQQKESLVARVLNSFPGTLVPSELELHGRISSFDLINAQASVCNVKFILMVDDAHDLYPDQLQLLKAAIEKKYSFPRWITTRKHIYPVSMLIGNPNGTTEGREVITIDIDSELRQASLYKKFTKILVDRRLKLTASLHEFSSENIEGMLSEDVELSSELKRNVDKKQREEAQKIKNDIPFEFPELDKFIVNPTNDPEDGELFLIRVNRIAKRKQLDYLVSFNKEDTASKDRMAADLFLRKRAELPLYSGFDSILAASNNNVEQFMRVFSPFIDRLIYRIELNKDTNISPSEQSAILEKIAKDYMEKIILRLPNGNKIYQLADNMGRFFSYRTYEPNAPHAPGVTQFALIASEIERLKENRRNRELATVLANAIAHNVFVPEGRQHQGAKGSEIKHVFSINRLLCVKYGLPMQKGDFQVLPLELLEDMCQRQLKPLDIKKRRRHQGQLWEEPDVDA